MVSRLSLTCLLHHPITQEETSMTSMELAMRYSAKTEEVTSELKAAVDEQHRTVGVSDFPLDLHTPKK